MGDVATNLASFVKAFDKAFERLLASPGGVNTPHDARQAHYRALLRVGEIFDHFVPKLPEAVSVPKLLQFGGLLRDNEDADLALTKCYGHILSLNLLEPAAADTKPVYVRLERTSHHVSALQGRAVCRSQLLLQADPCMAHPDTLAGLLTCLQVRLQF
jgi:hypothetical protein